MIGQYVTVHGDVISHVNISAVRVEDGGEYRCSAVNRVAKAHHAARLNIYGLPHVRAMGKYAAVAGETTVIKCPVAGFPIASITWEKGSPIMRHYYPTRFFPYLKKSDALFYFFKKYTSRLIETLWTKITTVHYSCKHNDFTYRAFSQTQFLFDFSTRNLISVSGIFKAIIFSF